MNFELVSYILAALLTLSEGLSLIPGIKSNGIFLLLVNIVKSLAAIFKKPVA